MTIHYDEEKIQLSEQTTDGDGNLFQDAHQGRMRGTIPVALKIIPQREKLKNTQEKEFKHFTSMNGKWALSTVSQESS